MEHSLKKVVHPTKKEHSLKKVVHPTKKGTLT